MWPTAGFRALFECCTGRAGRRRQPVVFQSSRSHPDSLSRKYLAIHRERHSGDRAMPNYLSLLRVPKRPSCLSQFGASRDKGRLYVVIGTTVRYLGGRLARRGFLAKIIVVGLGSALLFNELSHQLAQDLRSWPVSRLGGRHEFGTLFRPQLHGDYSFLGHAMVFLATLNNTILSVFHTDIESRKKANTHLHSDCTVCCYTSSVLLTRCISLA